MQHIDQAFDEAVEYLYSIPKFTTKNPPEHTKSFLALLGSPQDDFATIHVAGSNGKGSVCKFLFEMLRFEGKGVGLFCSPHLVDIRERFLISIPKAGEAAGSGAFLSVEEGDFCSKEEFLAAYMQVRDVADRQRELTGSYPTFFEFLFALGMVLFRESGVEVAVLETGLGGRLDATNAVAKPLLTILTSISLEHTEYLGDTLEQIAAEKAGILKPGVPVIFDGTETKAVSVITERAGALGCPAVMVTSTVESSGMDADTAFLERRICRIREIKRNLIDFSLSTPYDEDISWQIPFAAPYQAMNASLAITAVDKLRQMGDTSLTTAQMQQVLSRVRWAGRMQEVAPGVILEGAHNVGGIRELVKTLRQQSMIERDSRDASPQETAAPPKPILLFSMVKDKDYHTAIRLLAGIDWDQVYVTKIPDQRGIPAEELQQIFKEENNLDVVMIEDYGQAYDTVMERKMEGQMVYCTGSLYFMGALLAHIREKEK